ncbi:bifunctional adenosylcobinamide kinase/adenosylcobinamide-phosphate guanylyltransferase [Cohnella cholangitidis]|uniref:Adenosylcobinamide kinase n=1 Tax=Cohnella cholangitidis TaxID=2598458 RepID=A0A7G5C4H2_9BACL|nr:bifunctional adenosylcobinamide kinase/adenosylcobinamide-phosphate guanylyltransferase [Cohnella cholangitidis]QMV44106.1 bifunctional adenosylcobinamide kinase/adenosylcobinamide-phosphate guanylyltransferase [Cohnella cholangitidis]
MDIVMVTGGVRSGKSAYAEELVLERSRRLSYQAKVLYVATGMRSDGEMKTRIEAHRLRRPDTWDTLEAPDELSADSYRGYDIVLVDTLSAWIGNRLMAVPDEHCRDAGTTSFIQSEIQKYIDELRNSKLRAAVIVTDEVGWGGVAMSPLGRWFQDVIGEANQKLASRADEVVAVISGLPWRLKG